MIRATVGVWANYATTVLFQILFAARYGTSAEASAFVISFGAVVAVAGIVSTAGQSIVVPRLLGHDRSLLAAPLRLLGAMTFVGVVPFVLAAAFRGNTADALVAVTKLDEAVVQDALRPAAAFGVLQVFAGALIAVALARGHRFIPAAAPAFPSVAAASALVAEGSPSLEALYTALALGSVVEIAVLALAVGRGISISNQGAPPVAAMATATVLQLGLLTLLPLLERLVASLDSSEGAADYHYAARSLLIVQQLLIGGFLLARLSDWSGLMRAGLYAHLRRSLSLTAVSAALLLILAASIALVAGRGLVALAYQHGTFMESDTGTVTKILLLSLPGFFAEGLVLLLSQALVAARLNWVAIGIGILYFTLRSGLIVGLGVTSGATGVAVAYSVSAIVILVVDVLALRFLPPARRDVSLIVKGAAVGGGTLATAAVCLVLAGGLSSGIQAALVVAMFGLLLLVFRPRLPLRVDRA